jgi:formate dehydrogenase maturation protein FdhE
MNEHQIVLFVTLFVVISCALLAIIKLVCLAIEDNNSDERQRYLKKERKKMKKLKCPKCGSNDINSDLSEGYRNNSDYEFSCAACNGEFIFTAVVTVNCKDFHVWNTGSNTWEPLESDEQSL